MIPKLIHYCWFGGNPLPELAEKCIESWKKYLPDYEIIEWNEKNFDVNIIPYTAEAYAAGKYAFVSDYARLWILYKYGGVYFDTDVEVIRSMDDILLKGPYMGYESDLTTHYINGAINPGLGFACEPNMTIIHKLLTKYDTIHFCVNGVMNKKTILAYTTETFLDNGLKIRDGIQECCGFTVYSPDWFNPKNSATGKIEITGHTRSIHHFMASWSSDSRLKKILKHLKYKVIIPMLPSKMVARIVKANKAEHEERLQMLFTESETNKHNK